MRCKHCFELVTLKVRDYRHYIDITMPICTVCKEVIITVDVNEQMHQQDRFNAILPDTFNFGEIALVLSRIKRWAGQGVSVCSVAEHSVRVGKVSGFGGLMHDAHEFMLGDMITPIKKILPDYQLLCKLLQRKIEKYYGFHSDCKIMDFAIAEWEWKNYFILGKKPWSQSKAYERFMAMGRVQRGVY